MIRIEIVGEAAPPPEPDRVVKFDFRRHANPHSMGTEQQVFLVALAGGANYGGDWYPLKIDGLRKKVYVRKVTFEALGFEVVVEN